VIASLPMYDLPEMRRAVDDWWRGLRGALGRAGVAAVPEVLTRNGSLEQLWLAPDLLISQTCGYPLTHALAGRVRLVATPCYGAPGCDRADYASIVLVREDHPAAGLADLRGGVCAINGRSSHSGYNALRAEIAPLAGGEAFFSRVIESGGHLASAALVARGEADVCAVDCVTHALVGRYRPAALAGTRVLTVSASAPGLPYVSRADAGADLVARLREALQRAVSDPALAAAREDLLLDDIQVLGLEEYARITAMEEAAAAAGYPELH